MNPRNALALVPVALGLLHENAVRQPAAAVAPPTATVASAAPKKKKATPKEFSVTLSDLTEWAKTVVVSIDQVKIEGNSGVHSLVDDCEIHFGAHSTEFQGDPDGLVLEPMNACADDAELPEGFDSWTAFAKSIKGKTITAAGVPRIWPEHLEGGSASNPDHAVELHPLTSVTVQSKEFKFAPNIFAGKYRGKDGNRGIASRVTVTVTKSGDDVKIGFLGGTIGNFTTEDLRIQRTSITEDSGGSFQMLGDVVMADDSKIPVRIVTVKGSQVNDVTIAKLKKKTAAVQTLDDMLVLYSLSPQSLLAAANKSTGNAVTVDRPVQLILYGKPEEE